MNRPTHKDPTQLQASICLKLGVIGALALSLQAAAPLEQGPSAPLLINSLCVAFLALALLILGIRGGGVQRAAVGFCLIAIVHLVSVTEAWTMPSAPLIASRLAASFSHTWFGIPVVGLLHAWAVLSLAWLSQDMLLRIAGHEQSRVVRGSALALSITVAVFGVRAAIGYATGSTSLLTF